MNRKVFVLVFLLVMVGVGATLYLVRGGGSVEIVPTPIVNPPTTTTSATDIQQSLGSVDLGTDTPDFNAVNTDINTL